MWEGPTRRNLLIGLASLPLLGEAAQPLEAASKPILVFVITDPWLMVIGSDSPVFALYENGDVIYKKDAVYQFMNLNDRELKTFLESLHLQSLLTLSKYYRPVDVSDQPTEFLYVDVGNRSTTASVYGSLEDPLVKSAIPPVLLSSFEKIQAFNVPTSKKWLPYRIEVMIWPYEYAPDESIQWPKGWSDLHDPSTIKRSEGYSIFVPSVYFDRLVSFLATQKEKGAIVINGKKWAASVRFPFPGEKHWMGAIN